MEMEPVEGEETAKRATWWRKVFRRQKGMHGQRGLCGTEGGSSGWS